MDILSILLILAALVFAVLGGLHIYSIVSYNRRLRKQRARARSQRSRRKQPKKLDLMAVFLFLTALLLAMLAMLVMKHHTPVTEPTDPTSETTAPTTEPTQPPETQAPETLEDGWMEENGNRYYLLEDGSKATGWQDISGFRYYFAKNGAMTTGWQKIDDKQYYFHPDGKMATGTVEIDGTNRFFDTNGQEILLVNPWTPVPAGYEPELIGLSTDYASEGAQVDQSCLNDLISMLEACNATGSTACVVSAYRSYDHQDRIFQRKINELINEGYSNEEAEAEAATVVALPGTSEHQLGLAVDIVDTSLWELTEAQENLPAQQWLMAHSWEYGFLFRYPTDKTDVTGIIYEPWHYRYVGKALAKTIHEAGLTLEEYIQNLN